MLRHNLNLSRGCSQERYTYRERHVTKTTTKHCRRHKRLSNFWSLNATKIAQTRWFRIIIGKHQRRNKNAQRPTKAAYVVWRSVAANTSCLVVFRSSQIFAALGFSWSRTRSWRSVETWEARDNCDIIVKGSKVARWGEGRYRKLTPGWTWTGRRRCRCPWHAFVHAWRERLDSRLGFAAFRWRAKTELS